MRLNKLGKGKIEDKPTKVGKKLKHAICNSFEDRIDKNSLCKECK